MKKSVRKETHNGTQPIRVLKHNLTHRLVDRNESLITKLYAEKKLSENIVYHIAELPLVRRQLPYIDSNGCINIHETYLSYMWITSFVLFVLYEEGVVIPDQVKRNIVPRKNQDNSILEITKELFDYSKSLIRAFSKWDKDYFPNPEYFDEDTDIGWYIVRANDLYVEAINFILYHEIAHADLEHLKRIADEDLTLSDIKELELEADSKAIELLLLNCKTRKVSELSIIIALASMIFFDKTLDGGPKHPDVDLRLENAITKINLSEDSEIWPMLVLFVKLWDEQFSHNFIHGEVYDTFKELFYDLIIQAKK